MNRKYLLDTCILVHLLRNHYGIADRIAHVGWDKCCVSEMSIVELFYGAEVSKNREQNIKEVEQLVEDLEVIPISVCIREFCSQKARLKRLGTMIEDFDLFIGCTAIATNNILVTENINHLSRLEGLTVENWVERK